MIDKLELAWDTYEFYTAEIVKCETTHHNTIKTLKRFVTENPNPKRYQRKRVKVKAEESCSKLNLLYNKQVESLNDLIEIYNTRVDIPPEREVDIEYLITLKNITVTLMHQMNQYKQQIEDILNS
jgi:hypothetical protein